MNFYAFIPRLLNMSLTASVAIVFVLLLRLMLKKAPKVISYALWAVVLFRLLCPISIESSFSLFGLMDAPTKGSTTLTTNIEYVPEDIVHTEHPAVALPIPGISNVINSTLPSGREQLVADPLEAPVTFATYVWLAGVLVMAAYSVISYRRLRQKLLTASPLRDNIYLADEITSPFVMGLIRPKIYLPSEMDEREQAYIIRHEQHHIRRGDHIIKALAFLALSIHWFNPLVWVAFIYSSKDMEMSCDEAVVKKMGDGILADYTASLLSLATGKQIIAGMPLAFGEGDTKSRIRNLANWRKPAFWVVLISVVACIASAVGLLTNPGPAREFPINGSNVSELDTEQIIEMIAKAERLGKNSQLYVYEENLMINQNFDWLFDGSLLRFYYFKSQKTYSGQLEMSRDENRFFIADTEEWTEPKRIYRLSDYLNALKYMPQEDIRQLYPNADTYVVSLLSHGDPSSYEHVITYTQNGIEDIDGWYIHLMVSPTYEAEPGGYYGSGEELLHLFYHSTGKTVSTAINTYIYEYDGIIGRFDIALGADGSFTYLESGYSSYLGHGTWKLSGDLITLTENVRVEDIPINRINHFKLDGDDLIYVAKDSFNFPHVKLEDGDRFHCTDEAFNLNNAGVTDLTSNEIVSSGQEVKLIPGNYDFDHDGVPESVEVLTYQGWFELQVKRADGTILWSDVAGAAHTGYNSLFACTLDGVDYLLRYHPTMYQGDSSYIYQLFSFDTQGNIIINREAEVYFDINWGSSMHREFNAAEIADFMDEVNDLLAHSKLLLSTDEALELIDPEHPQDIPWWLLDGTYCSGYVYDESKSLRDNLLELERFINS